jgi:hypothetical protein
MHPIARAMTLTAARLAAILGHSAFWAILEDMELDRDESSCNQ